MKKCILLCLFAPLLFIACSDDDYVYPNVLTEMIDLVTDNTGTATYLKSDEGVIWSIQPRAGLDGLTPDSVYRTVTMYAPVNTSQPSSLEAILYNTQIAISPIPKAKDTFKEIHTDPDKHIHQNYHLYAGNYVACDLLMGDTRFAEEYTEEEKVKFEKYLEGQIAKIDLPNKDIPFLRNKILTMYANPLINYLEAAKG
jgi:hypothetical protein